MATENGNKSKLLIIGAIVTIILCLGAVMMLSGGKNSITPTSANGAIEYKKGTEFAKEGKFKEALDMYEKAAEAGNLNASNAAGWYLTHGRTGVEKDIAKGMSYLKKAADGGHPGSAYALGQAYMGSVSGVKKDVANGVKYIQLAADRGHGTAMYVMGIYCELGIGIKKDKEKALDWYDKAINTTTDKNIKTKAIARAEKLRTAGN